MHPIICEIGPFTVYSYGLMLAISAFVCIFLLSCEAKRQGFNPDIIIDFVFWILVSGIVGGRIFYVLLNLAFFKQNPKEIFMLWHGGLVWYGGLFAGIIFGLLYLKIKKLPMLKTIDLVAPYASLGQAIGRIGCFLNGCCFGKTVSLGAYSFAQFPVQLFSSLNLCIIFLILKYRQKKSHPTGEIFFLYLMLASLERFIAEFFRGDSSVFIGNLTIFQIISLIVLVVSFYGKILLTSKKRG